MGDSVTPEILGNMIRQYFSQERPEEEAIQGAGGEPWPRPIRSAAGGDEPKDLRLD